MERNTSKVWTVYKDDSNFRQELTSSLIPIKSKSVPKLEVLKDIKKDPDNPFGSLIKDADQGGQYWYTDKKGYRKLGLINKRSDEGDWGDWKDALPSQFLSKQSKAMAEKQLGIAKADKQAEFDSIMALTNPTVKKYYLHKFAEDCDSAAVHLKGASLPGQKYYVILPVTSLSEKEVYAPGYPDGSKLALIRYPHGGTFEIPICTVNNKNKEAISMIGKTSQDAIGINSKVADRLSGADFDGDTVMGMNLNEGGHLTHGSPVNISGKYFNFVPYGVDPETHRIDYDKVLEIAKECKPKMIVAGASAYPRIIDFAKLREIADAVGA